MIENKSYEFRINAVDKYMNIASLKSYKDFYNSKTLLVTGGVGAIGSNLVIALSRLVGKTGKIIVLDNLTSSKTASTWNLTPMENLLFVKGDVRSEID